MRHRKLVHAVAEVAKSLRSFLENVFAEAIADEYAFTETKRIPLVVQRFDIQSRVRANNGQAHGIGTGVDRGNVNRFGHSGF